MNQSPHLTKDSFAWVILSHVILSALNVNNISSLQYWQGKDIAFQNHQFWLYVYKITRALNVKSLVYVSGLRNNCLHATKMYYTTVQNCNLMSRGKHLNFQHSF